MEFISPFVQPSHTHLGLFYRTVQLNEQKCVKWIRFINKEAARLVLVFILIASCDIWISSVICARDEKEKTWRNAWPNKQLAFRRQPSYPTQAPPLSLHACPQCLLDLGSQLHHSAPLVDLPEDPGSCRVSTTAISYVTLLWLESAASGIGHVTVPLKASLQSTIWRL